MFSTSMLGMSLRQRGNDDSLRHQAYRKLKDRIISGEIPPASLIDEKALAKELKLGYTPIRQALRWLALENLVVILPRRGTIVADVNFGDLQKIYEVRLQMVPHAFMLAAKRRSEDQLKKMEAFLESAKEDIATGDCSRLLAVDRKAQEMVIEASHNEFLIEILERLHSQAMRFWRMDRIREADLRREVKQHRQILAALKGHDEKQASRLIHDIIVEFHRAQNAAI